VLRLATLRTDVGCGLAGCFAVDVEHEHLRAFSCVAERYGAAYSRTRAGDDSDVILQKPWHCSVP
jgi:hypothetical protein